LCAPEEAVLNFLLKKANIVAISLVFFTFGFLLGKDVFDLTLGEEIIVISASVACAIAILTSLYVSKLDGFRALDHAASAKQRAANTEDPLAREEDLVLANRWESLARSFGLSDRLNDFTQETKRRVASRERGMDSTT
jgi:hypothetical protein